MPALFTRMSSPSNAVDGFIDHALRIGGDADIALDQRRTAAGLLDLSGSRLGWGASAGWIIDRHVGAFLRESYGDGLSDPLPAPVTSAFLPLSRIH